MIAIVRKIFECASLFSFLFGAMATAGAIEFDESLVVPMTLFILGAIGLKVVGKSVEEEINTDFGSESTNRASILP